MQTTVNVCDFSHDGPPPTATDVFTFTFNGQTHTMDACAECVEELTAWLPVTKPSRRNGRPKTYARRYDATPIREWARKHGYEVSDKGRLPTDVLAAYETATAK